MSEDAEEDQLSEVSSEVEMVIEIPIVESGTYLYVCSACGGSLTEIPYYNRYYCANCSLHY